jgi:hypothetical protein
MNGDDDSLHEYAKLPRISSVLGASRAHNGVRSQRRPQLLRAGIETLVPARNR